jgi:hypothetical protein
MACDESFVPGVRDTSRTAASCRTCTSPRAIASGLPTTGPRRLLRGAVSSDESYLQQDDDPVWYHYVVQPDGGAESSGTRLMEIARFWDPLDARCPWRFVRWSAGFSLGITPPMESASSCAGCPVHLLEPGQDLSKC